MAEVQSSSVDSFEVHSAMSPAPMGFGAYRTDTAMQRASIKSGHDERQLDLETGVISTEGGKGMMDAVIASPTLVQKAVAELVATFFLVFAGCGAIVIDKQNGGIIAHVAIAMTFGIALMIMIYTTGHVSGGHVNPAVTLAFAIVGRFPWLEVPAYLAAQLSGSILASVLLRLILNDGNVFGLAVTQPSHGNVQSLLMEALITFILMFVISGVATDSRAVKELAGLAIGATVGINGVFAGPVSGASMNPARSIGAAIVARNFKSLYVYIAGPIIGAVIGACSYNIIRLPNQKATADDQALLSKSFLKAWFKF